MDRPDNYLGYKRQNSFSMNLSRTEINKIRKRKAKNKAARKARKLNRK